jgi:hypothetical protein
MHGKTLQHCLVTLLKFGKIIPTIKVPGDMSISVCYSKDKKILRKSRTIWMGAL